MRFDTPLPPMAPTCVQSNFSSEGRHTAHEQQAEARITYRFHPRFGETVGVRRRLERGGAAFLVVHQLDGTFACLPAWMTDEATSRFEISVEPHFPLDVLCSLRNEVDALLGFLASESKTERPDNDAPIRESSDKPVRGRATVRRTACSSKERRRSQPVDATLYLEREMECGLMVHRFHRGFTAAEKTELWDRWKRGESLKAIGRAFGKQSSSIYFLVAPHGGIRPGERRRSRLALTLAEREVISRGVTAHRSARSIAKLLGRSPSTVSREMSRNGGCDRYRAALADENAWARARRPKCCKLANSPRLRRAVAAKLRLDWSPEQIAGWLKRTHPEDECNQVSHETIYRSLFVQTRGVLKNELLSHLRSKRSMRRSQPVDPNGDRRDR